ncbi:probable G-protein coupled receptor Mth-like 3 [Argiope bruennichi]|uniref:Putative G-protein coupled receptor Mth-like 2 n=1 Tax=Argiope bruennichi TaxID=94029 RepID=A0A8T0EP23_ARGBR|nr:probable G-protein coupled receptor Mth-like 3 [Argiope bruennichi]XP_055946326.1 probable G-protein coupled receptor Mth-like 3 [Argiope bruennichi]KAF8777014.1 putative G-protein coupled receptor Mth-like 2 [Argiope bruennichi]
MNWCTSKSSLMLLFWTIICCIPTCSAGHRVIRSSNSSQFIHHELEPKEETSEEVDFCMNISDAQSDQRVLSKRSDVDTSTESVESAEEIEFEQRFVECLKTVVEFGCYEILPNKSVHVPIYNKRQFRPTQYFIDPNTKELFICPDFFDESKFPETLAIVSLVGTAISAFCIVLHVTMFMVFKKLRNLPGYCLVSLCVALLVAYLCTFIPYFRKEVSDCTATGVIKAFAFLGSFFWMNVMSYDIWRSLRMATAKLRLTGDRPMLTRFAIYSAYAWGVPLFIIVVGLIVDASPGSDEKYRLIMQHDSCWFRYKQALLVYFAIPLFVLLFFNVALFISSFCMINSATMKKSENKADLWSRFLVSFRLAVVMGLMWIFGVLATSSEAMWLWYLYVLCNVLQGVFIFFSFTFTEKTRKECRKAIAKKKSSTMPTQVSSQQSSSV